MSFSDVIILGPTSTGKTDLANLISFSLDAPIFNCDSVQVYKDLNVLTNKPNFNSQKMERDELVSYINFPGLSDLSRWKDFKFKCIEKEKDVEVKEFEDYKEFLKYIERKKLFKNKIERSGKLLKSYLFDIKEPANSYSLADWKYDIKRIVENTGNLPRILVGGTVYYAYHYIFGTEFLEDFVAHEEVKKLREEISNESLSSLIEELREKDADTLNLIDLNNKQRVAKAVEFIRRSGKNFSENYFKNVNMLEDFFLIMIYPKDKDKYYSTLDGIVEKRMSFNAFKEIDGLISKYGEKVKPWLEKVSYEYLYAIKIKDLLENNKEKNNYVLEDKPLPETIYKEEVQQEIKKLISELKLAERHYAKRQMTFMRKLEKDLLKFKIDISEG